MKRLLSVVVAIVCAAGFATNAEAQLLEILDPFDPVLPCLDEDGDPYGMNTHGLSVSGDGLIIVGNAQKFQSTDIGLEGECVVLSDEVIYRWENGVSTELPFSGRFDLQWPRISADGKTILGRVEVNGPVMALQDGALSLARFGEWTLFRAGMQGRSLPGGGWEGTTSNPNMRVRSVSDDFTTFVGEIIDSNGDSSRAAIWTKEEEVLIGPLSGFGRAVAMGVSADGAVVCGYSYEAEDEDDWTGIPGFVWTRETGVTLIRDLVRSQGFPFEENFPDIVPFAMSADGGTVVGEVDGVEAAGRVFAFRLNLGPSLTISVDPDRPLKRDEEAIASVKLVHRGSEPALYTFGPSLLSIDPDKSLELEFIEPVAPVTLTTDDAVREYHIRFIAKKAGFVTLRSQVGFGTSTAKAENTILVSPLKVAIKVTPEELLLNQTAEDKLADRAKALNLERKEASPPLPPYKNLVEIEMTVKNESDLTVKGLTMPDVRSPLSFIQNVDLKNPGVPLKPIRLYPPTGGAVDLTNPEDQTEVKDVDLGPGDEAKFAWLLDAFDGNSDPEADNSTKLEFEGLVLAGLDGKNIRGFATKEFTVVDRPLLEWGIRPKEKRTNYLSGQAVRVEGYIENISTKDDRPPQDIRVMVYQIPKGNLGGGFMFDSTKAGGATPRYYEIFELPGEGPGKSLDIESILLSMPTVIPSSGTVRYGVRLWALEKDAKAPGGVTATNADSQKVIKEGWDTEFDVNFGANRPAFTSQEECYVLGKEIPQLSGIWPFLCGLNEGLVVDFTDGIIGLGQFLFKGGEELLNAGVGIAAWEFHTFGKVIKATLGDEQAKQALLQELYVQYRTYVELGVMTGKAGSQVPMVFEAFSVQAVGSLSDFLFAVEKRDIKAVEFAVGKFLGSNPDMIFEPLVVANAYQKASRALVKLENELVDNAVRNGMRLEEARRAESIEQRLADAIAAGKAPETALLPGDILSDSKLLDIYGVTREQKKAIQKIAKDNGATITFRSRNPLSVNLLKQGKAYPKPQALKYKTVNQIDVDFLGYRKEAKATLEIVEPPAGLLKPDGTALSGDDLRKAIDVEMKKFKSKINGNSVLDKEVRTRMETRAEEWNKLVLKDIDPSKPGQQAVGITTNFDVAAQYPPSKARDLVKEVGAVEPRVVTYDAIPGRKPRTWEMKMTGPDLGPSKSITGDVDFLAVLDEFGGIIRDSQKRREIYAQLASALDMQHGESYTFFIQQTRLEHLRCCVEGGEAMVAISALGDQIPRAALFLDNLSIIDNVGSRNAKYLPKRKKIAESWLDYILRPGELKEARRVDPTGEFMLLDGIPVNTKPPLDLVNRFIPDTLGQRLARFVTSPVFFTPAILRSLFRVENKEATFSRGEDGQVLQAIRDARNPENYLLRRWTEASGWQMLTMDEALAVGDPDVLELAPMTNLANGGDMGSERVEITEQALLAPGDFFEPGDRVVINPGGENEHYTTIRALGSLIFTSAFLEEHQSGEMIVSLGPDSTDRDGDTLTGMQEIALGTDPDNADSDFDGQPDNLDPSPTFGDSKRAFEVANFVTSESQAGSEIWWNVEAGNTYTIEASEGLVPGTWLELETITANASELQKYSLANPFPAGRRVFYRVRRH